MAKLRPAQTGLTGLAVWRLPNSSLEIMWSGPGGRLMIGQATSPGGAVTTIDHPSADGSYQTRSEAQAAVDAFVAALDD